MLSSKLDLNIFFFIIQNMKTQINSYWNQILKIKYFQKLRQTSTIKTFYYLKFVFSWCYGKYIFENHCPIISPKNIFLVLDAKKNYQNLSTKRDCFFCLEIFDY